jgi:molecular chaperone HscC
VTAAEFEELVAPLVERLRGPTLRALRDARLTPNGIDEVLLIGGATRMPVVRRMASELFGRPPLDSVDPDQAVALGAAVQAALVADDAAVDDLVMTDVCPHTLGVEIVKEFGARQVEGYFMPVLHRNTTIPVSREEIVHTVEDGQREVLVKVYQGEGRRVEDNLFLGELVVRDLPPGPRGQELCLRFTYDLNGLLEVEAYVPATGKKHSTVLRNHARDLSDAEVRASQERMQALKFYPREDLENQRLLAFANAALKEVDRFGRDDLEGVIDHFEASLHLNEREVFAFAKEQLLVKLSALGLPYRAPRDGDDAG